MKVTSIELHPSGSAEAIVFSFRDPQRLLPYNVKGIVGLDADEITPMFYGGPGGATKFFNLSPKKKTIMIRADLNPNFVDATYSSLRDAVYKAIASSRTGLIELQFKNAAATTAVISGFITKMESPLSNKEQEIQITVECTDQFLKGPARVNVDVSAMDPATTLIQDDLSNAPHGLVFQLEILADIADLTITDPDDDTWQFKIVPAGGFDDGDILHYSSETGNKYLYLVRGLDVFGDPNIIYLADVVDIGSIWPILFPGTNTFHLTHPTSVDWTSIQHYPTYWGV